MSRAYFFDVGTMEWSSHPQFPDIRFKALATRETHPAARFSLVKVEVGGKIDAHLHEDELETVYVLAGQGTLNFGAEEALLKRGMGVTIPARLTHSLRNSGPVELELFAVHVLAAVK